MPHAASNDSGLSRGGCWIGIVHACDAPVVVLEGSGEGHGIGLRQAGRQSYGRVLPSLGQSATLFSSAMPLRNQ